MNSARHISSTGKMRIFAHIRNALGLTDSACHVI